MDGKKGTLRQRWAQRSEDAYRRMFEGKSQEELVTLSQRETMAMLIAKELAAFMLEEHVALDAAAKPTSPESACCPKCSQAGMPAGQKEDDQKEDDREEDDREEDDREEDDLPERKVVTRAGEIGVRRQKWRCAKCRILFFSARHSSAIGDGGLQSGGAREGDASGGEGAVVRRGKRRSSRACGDRDQRDAFAAAERTDRRGMDRDSR